MDGADLIAPVRRFNRTVTERIGVLTDDYLARSRPLGASRVLWEIGEAGSDVRALRARLRLDSGYLSRLLRGLEADGLIATQPGEGDRRVRAVTLTAAGRAERAELDRLSDAHAGSLMAPLTGRQRDRLIEAMGTVERLLTASLVEIGVSEPGGEVAQLCLKAYFAELETRFDGGFDTADGLAGAAEYAAPGGLLLVARLRDEPVGCGALRFIDGEPSQVKRMWVARSARGLGLGRRLLAELEERARERGATAIRLETNRVLSEAISLYRSAGYAEVPPFNDEPYAHHWFEKPLPPR
jgi:DNA-binding MarR family transcriptional regulator/GNAT superfamily N-acetyltransferase